MLQDKRYIIFGLTRLALRVSSALIADRASVTIIMIGSSGESLKPLVSPDVTVIPIQPFDIAKILSDNAYLNLNAVECILTLSDDDQENLRVAVHIRRMLPNVPVVVRSFEPSLAEQLEMGLHVRRAFGVASLAAPAFVTSVLGHTVLETLRLGDSEAPIVRMPVTEDGSLAGLKLSDIKSLYHCALIAWRSGMEKWVILNQENEDYILKPGDEILVGGLLTDILKLCSLNSVLPGNNAQSSLKRIKRPWRRRTGTITRLPIIAAILSILLIGAIFFFAQTLHLKWVDAFYFVVTTATTTGYGDISLKDNSWWVKMAGCLVMIAGGGLFGIIFTQLTAMATTDRLEEIMGRRAAKMRGHILVIGLGNLGYRVVRLLTNLKLKVVVLEAKPNSRFVEAVRARCPVITGDARLEEDLTRAGVHSCSAIIACTDDDLSNIQACLFARKVNRSVRTVSRIFDDLMAEQLSEGFELDIALSASQVAASAFVGAAVDEKAYRSIRISGLTFAVFRYTAADIVTSETIHEWRHRGVRVIAWRHADGPPLPPEYDQPALEPCDEVILCGPPDVIREIGG